MPASAALKKAADDIKGCAKARVQSEFLAQAGGAVYRSTLADFQGNFGADAEALLRARLRVAGVLRLLGHGFDLRPVARGELANLRRLVRPRRNHSAAISLNTEPHGGRQSARQPVAELAALAADVANLQAADA